MSGFGDSRLKILCTEKLGQNLFQDSSRQAILSSDLFSSLMSYLLLW